MLLAAGVAAVSVLARVFQVYLGSMLYIEWREWLTDYFVNQGFAHRAFYRMGLIGKVDNPDQRISDDIGSFVESTETFAIQLVFAIAGVVTYFAILWSISSTLALFLIVYATMGTYLSAVIGRRLVGLNYYQERFQADFRFGLVHVRHNLEPIFIYGGERHETEQLHRRFAKVVNNFKQLILWKRNLGFFTESYGAVARLVPYWFLAAGYVAGRLQFGQVAQAAVAFASLHEALSIIVTSFPMLATFANVVVRLSEFLEEEHAAGTFEAEGRQMIVIDEAPHVGLEHLTVLMPGGDKTLIRDLSADLSALGPLLVQGPQRHGKDIADASAGWHLARGQRQGEPPRLIGSDVSAPTPLPNPGLATRSAHLPAGAWSKRPATA
jgi:vitamin B12/bleomycin/antimicrobial peptide transport system ATP-binding/permease protein